MHDHHLTTGLVRFHDAMGLSDLLEPEYARRLRPEATRRHVLRNLLERDVGERKARRDEDAAELDPLTWSKARRRSAIWGESASNSGMMMHTLEEEHCALRAIFDNSAVGKAAIMPNWKARESGASKCTSQSSLVLFVVQLAANGFRRRNAKSGRAKMELSQTKPIANSATDWH